MKPIGVERSWPMVSTSRPTLYNFVILCPSTLFSGLSPEFWLHLFVCICVCACFVCVCVFLCAYTRIRIHKNIHSYYFSSISRDIFNIKGTTLGGNLWIHVRHKIPTYGARLSSVCWGSGWTIELCSTLGNSMKCFNLEIAAVQKRECLSGKSYFSLTTGKFP